MSNFQQKKRLVYRSLAKMFYDLVKIPILAVLFNPLVNEQFSLAFLVFGSGFTLLFIYTAVIFEINGEEI